MATSRNRFTRACRRLVTASWFQNLVTVLILISAVLTGLDTNPVLPFASPIVSTLLLTISILFGIEIAIRIIAEWPQPLRFFRSSWNIFDFLIVVLCLLPGASKVALVLRLARVLRVLRVITAVPGLRIIVSAMLDSLPAVGYVVMLLGLHFYVYAVLGVALFGQNDPGHFGNLGRCALTLFSVLTLEGWVDVMYTQMLGAAVHPSSLPMAETVSHASPIWGALYFVSFILLGTIVIMNLFVGVVINAIQEAHTAAAKRAAEEAKRIEDSGIIKEHNLPRQTPGPPPKTEL